MRARQPRACSSRIFSLRYALRRALPSDLAFGEKGFHPFIKKGDAVLFELQLLKLLEHGLARNFSVSNVSSPEPADLLRPV